MSLIVLTLAAALLSPPEDTLAGPLPLLGGPLSMAEVRQFAAVAPARPAPRPPQTRRRRAQERPRVGRRPVQRRRRGSSDRWQIVALAPYAGPRNNAWHGFLNTPPLEAASVLPPGLWQFHGVLDFSTTDWSADSPGGRSQFNNVGITETFQIDYGLNDWLLTGVRLTTGELGESGDTVFRLYENGQQIVPTGERGFGVESIVARGKMAFKTSGVDLGALTEFKIPLAGEDDFLSAGTLDWGVSALVSKQWARFGMHGNLGFVFPLGDADLFIANDDVDPYFHGGLAGSYRITQVMSLLAQVEFNTSAFGDVSEWDAPALVLNFGGRYRLGQSFFLAGTIGFGLSDESGGLALSSAVDLMF